uniref:Nuclear cap-binding protein subunit 3 n=1 Tax=Lygus hesperus TaxID=30085 RepID=A0A0A9WDQ6_LYGHE
MLHSIVCQNPSSGTSAVDPAKKTNMQRRIIHLNPQQQFLEIDFDVTSLEEQRRREHRRQRFSIGKDDSATASGGAVSQSNASGPASTPTPVGEAVSGGAADLNTATVAADATSESTADVPRYLVGTELELEEVPEVEVQRELQAFSMKNSRRWDTIHMFGTCLVLNSLSTEDIFQILFNSMPCHSVEWISDYRCNVHFNTVHDSKRALHTLSSCPPSLHVNTLRNLLSASVVLDSCNFDSHNAVEFVAWRDVPLQQFSNHTSSRHNRKRRRQHGYDGGSLQGWLRMRISTLADQRTEFEKKTPSQYYAKFSRPTMVDPASTAARRVVTFVPTSSQGSHSGDSGDGGTTNSTPTHSQRKFTFHEDGVFKSQDDDGRIPHVIHVRKAQ